MKNEAAIMTGIQQMEIREVPMPVCGENDVLMKSDYVGVCGSDVHYYEFGKLGANEVKPPFILGHEYSGTIIETGKNVKNVKAGDRVALEPGITCGHCRFCNTGRYNICESLRFPSCPPYDGFLQRYTTHPAHLTFRLPENVTSLNGALMEPLAVGLYSASEGKVELGKTVAILGSGCIGLTTILACKQHQASKIIATDLFDSRLERARNMGAHHVINSSKVDPVEEIMKLTGGRGVDIAFETAGNKHTAMQTSYVVARGGRIVIVGILVGDTALNFRSIGQKEADIKVIWRYKNVYPIAIKAIEEGYIKLDGIVSHTFDFAESKKAFDTAIHDKEHVIKTAISF
jgi:L-iditol 2-dehydrogenase